MTSLQRTVLLAFLALVVGVFVYANIEAYEEEVNLPFSAEAYRSPYLAMQRHLAHYDISVGIFDDLSSLLNPEAEVPVYPSTDALIILSEAETSIPLQQANDLLNWVERGGHIVVGGVTSNDSGSSFSTNHFLKTFGVSAEPIRNSTDAVSLEAFEPTKVESQYYGNIALNLRPSTYIQVHGRYEPIYLAGKSAGPTLVQLQYGEGIVTLMTDVSIWNNWHLQQQDHALWLHELSMDTPSVFVFSSVQPAMWYALIAEYSPTFYYVLLCAVLLFLWHLSVRFGAIKHDNDSFVTYFYEHIKAAGEYYWHSGQKQTLLASVRAQILDDLHQKHGKHFTNNTQIIESLASISAWPEDSIYTLLFSEEKLTQAQFVDKMQGLQQLKKMI